MARLSEHHKVLTDGEGKCSVPMWMGGCPSGFCDRPAHGERPRGETLTRWDGYEYRLDGLYPGCVPALACPMHGGPKARTFMDGNAWCAVGPDFVDLQASHAGFGATREEAIAAFNTPHLGKSEQ